MTAATSKPKGSKGQLDQGNGSGGVPVLVANGTYDVGFGDMNALIELAAKKPDEAPVAVYVMYNQPPFTIAVKADSPIKTAKDLEGKTIGGAANDGALKLFPAFCKIAKIDCTTVKLSNMQPNLRENMLMQGQVDGVFGYVNTIRFSAKLAKIDESQDPLHQVRRLRHGPLFQRHHRSEEDGARKSPKLVKGFLRALNKGMQDSIKDPEASVAAVAKREPLINSKLERERFDATFADEMNHPEIKKIGLGSIDEDRLKRSIAILVDALALPRSPAVSEIWNPAFLPPAAELPHKLF